uniref:Interferon regulatory factor 3 n=1 Tax=Panthera tigris altaica TaxID=74533 RepID=A0A8C9K9W6_PANTA
MALAPFPDGGPSSLPMVPEETPPFLLSPSVDIPAPCPNLQPPENPLRRLLVPEEGCSHLSQGPAGHGTVRGRLLTGDHRGPAHLQQLPTLPHLGPVQGLPPGPGRRHGFLGHWGDLTPHSS